MIDSRSVIDSYLKKTDWRVAENSNSPYSFGALNKYVIGEVSKQYWLDSVYTKKISNTHRSGKMHIHDLGGCSLYCSGYSLRDILVKGVRGVPNIPVSSPAKHFDSVLSQIVNLTTIFQNEIMGAVAFNSFDTLLAPFVKKDALTYKQIEQQLQNFIFAINSNSRAGAEPAFSNITLDIFPPDDLIDTPVIIGGEPQDFVYRDCQEQQDMINRAFCSLMLRGDSNGRPFSYPIPTYNIHKGFKWDNPNNDLLWEMAGKYGYPYFANYVNSDMDASDSRSMCPMTPDTKVFVRNVKYGEISILPIGQLYKSNNLNNTEYEFLVGGEWIVGTPNRVLKTEVYEITFSNGTSVRFGGNHLQPIIGGETLRTKDLKIGMMLPFNKTPYDSNLGEYDFGFAVGAYIGDGSRDDTSIIYSLCAFDKDVDTECMLRKFWNRMGFKVTTTFTDNIRSVRVSAGSYNLINRYVDGGNALTKSLTQLCYSTSKEFRTGMLYGMRATDGARTRNRLYTSSPYLRTDFCSLLVSIGIKCLINNVDTRDNRLGGHPCYRIDYPFRSSYSNIFKTDDDYNYFSIIDIKKVDYEGDYLYCVELDSEDQLFTLWNGLVTHNCRLRLDLTELKRRSGGLFGSGDSTGSVGVCTVNLPRIAYNTQNNKKRFFKELDKVLEIAKDSLEIKRVWLNEHIIQTRAIPAFCEYVGKLDNYFSTIGIVGMNEMCENFFQDGTDITTDKGREFAIEVGNHIREVIQRFQVETGNFYNYEATPAESTCYRLAKKDVDEFDDIITRGTKDAPYYTNSCHIPVSKIESINETFKHQEPLQTQFTGGTVIHIYMNGSISGDKAKSIIKSCCENYKVPYVSLSPINRYCPEHGYVEKFTDVCPQCGKKLDLYQRITGYLRKVEYFNDGKRSEFFERKQLNESDDQK